MPPRPRSAHPSSEPSPTTAPPEPEGIDRSLGPAAGCGQELRLAPRSSERRLSQGVGNPLEWSVVERSRLMILLTIPFYALYGLRSAYLIDHPEIEPYFDRAWLVVMRGAIGPLAGFRVSVPSFSTRAAPEASPPACD